MIAWIANARKALIGVLGVIGQLLAAGVLTGSALHYAQVVIAVAAAVGVYAVPNAAKPVVSTGSLDGPQ